MSISSQVVPVGASGFGALRAIFENSEYSDLGLKSRKGSCFALGSRWARAHLRCKAKRYVLSSYSVSWIRTSTYTRCVHRVVSDKKRIRVTHGF